MSVVLSSVMWGSWVLNKYRLHVPTFMNLKRERWRSGVCPAALQFQSPHNWILYQPCSCPPSSSIHTQDLVEEVNLQKASIKTTRFEVYINNFSTFTCKSFRIQYKNCDSETDAEVNHWTAIPKCGFYSTISRNYATCIRVQFNLHTIHFHRGRQKSMDDYHFTLGHVVCVCGGGG